jgi:hypothetical protein
MIQQLLALHPATDDDRYAMEALDEELRDARIASLLADASLMPDALCDALLITSIITMCGIIIGVLLRMKKKSFARTHCASTDDGIVNVYHSNSVEPSKYVLVGITNKAPDHIIEAIRNVLLTVDRWDGMMPIHRACDARDGGAQVRALLKDGIFVSEQLRAKMVGTSTRTRNLYDGLLPIHLAIRHGDVGTVEALLSAPCDAETKKFQLTDCNALAYAVEHDNVEVAVYLMQQHRQVPDAGMFRTAILTKYDGWGDSCDRMINELITASDASTLGEIAASFEKEDKAGYRLMGYRLMGYRLMECLAMHPLCGKRPAIRSMILKLFVAYDDYETHYIPAAVMRVIREVCLDYTLYDRVNEAILLGLQHRRQK